MPAWELGVKTTTWVEHWKPGKPEVTQRTTQLSFPSTYTSQGPPAPLLLYSLHVRFRGMAHSWQLASSLP